MMLLVNYFYIGFVVVVCDYLQFFGVYNKEKEQVRLRFVNFYIIFLKKD